MIKTTKEQRKALQAKFKLSSLHSRGPIDRITQFRTEHHYSSYKHFRKNVAGTYGCNGAITVYWCNMWLCIEKDGYTHT